MSQQEIVKMANSLLSQHGFSPDGSPKKDISKKQGFFEKKVIMMTPMGNGGR